MINVVEGWKPWLTGSLLREDHTVQVTTPIAKSDSSLGIGG